MMQYHLRTYPCARQFSFATEIPISMIITLLKDIPTAHRLGYTLQLLGKQSEIRILSAVGIPMKMGERSIFSRFFLFCETKKNKCNYFKSLLQGVILTITNSLCKKLQNTERHQEKSLCWTNASLMVCRCVAAKCGEVSDLEPQIP